MFALFGPACMVIAVIMLCRMTLRQYAEPSSDEIVQNTSVEVRAGSSPCTLDDLGIDTTTQYELYINDVYSPGSYQFLIDIFNPNRFRIWKVTDDVTDPYSPIVSGYFTPIPNSTVSVHQCEAVNPTVYWPGTDESLTGNTSGKIYPPPADNAWIIEQFFVYKDWTHRLSFRNVMAKSLGKVVDCSSYPVQQKFVQECTLKKIGLDSQTNWTIWTPIQDGINYNFVVNELYPNVFQLVSSKSKAVVASGVFNRFRDGYCYAEFISYISIQTRRRVKLPVISKFKLEVRNLKSWIMK